MALSLPLSHAITPAGAYYLFVALSLCACAFLATSVPETKGKSLEDIEREMAERYLPTTELISMDSASMEIEVGTASTTGQVVV